MARWMLYHKKADFQAIAKELEISPVTARLIRNRNVIGVDETRRFLYGTMADLDDPARLPGLRDAAYVVKHKILEGARIRVIGDYDVDGICSTYILWRLITFLGGNVSTAIPERIRDGYGINERLVREAIRDDVDTIITCDNGIAAAEPLRLAKEAGLTVIVTDHHEIPYREETLPQAENADASDRAGDCPETLTSDELSTIFAATTRKNLNITYQADDCAGLSDSPGEGPSSGVGGGRASASEGSAAFSQPGASGISSTGIAGGIRKHYIYPPADVIAEPWIPDETTGKPIARFPSICGAAVVFKLAMLLLGRPDLTGPKSADEPAHVLLARELLGFAAIATVCDVMPLQDENRILVREGLKEAARTDNVGLRCLMLAAGLDRGTLTVYHAGFVVGPCLNASGRLDKADRALALFQEQDENRAMIMARDLKQLNDSRKGMTEEGVSKALHQIAAEDAAGRPLAERKVLIVRLDDCHESLAGIIAGRLREQYHRPVIVLTRSGGEEGVPEGGPEAAAGTAAEERKDLQDRGPAARTSLDSPENVSNAGESARKGEPILLKGSGRSIEAYDMFEQMNRCRELFVKFGGHKMAAGLTISAENAAELDRRLNADCTLTEEEMDDVLHIDMELPPAYVTKDLVHEFDLLEPCGTANPGVLLVTRDLTLRRTAVFGKNHNVNRIEATDAQGRSYSCVWFAAQDRLPEVLRGGGTARCNVVYEPKINEWKGRESVQLEIKDIRVLQSETR